MLANIQYLYVFCLLHLDFVPENAKYPALASFLSDPYHAPTIRGLLLLASSPAQALLLQLILKSLPPGQKVKTSKGIFKQIWDHSRQGSTSFRHVGPISSHLPAQPPGPPTQDLHKLVGMEIHNLHTNLSDTW